MKSRRQMRLLADLAPVILVEVLLLVALAPGILVDAVAGKVGRTFSRDKP